MEEGPGTSTLTDTLLEDEHPLELVTVTFTIIEGGVPALKEIMLVPLPLVIIPEDSDQR